MPIFTVDRANGALLYTTSYYTSFAIYEEYDPPLIRHDSVWMVSYTEVGGPGAQHFQDSSSDAETIVGPLDLGLDPATTVKTYEMFLESYGTSGDSEAFGFEFVTVQSAAYATADVVLEGKETGAHNWFMLRDVLIGGSGADQLRGLNGDDWLDGGGAADLLEGGNGHDSIVGGDADDTLHGNAHNDLLVGGAGADMLLGGTEDDTYVVDALDTVIELVGEGTDTILTTANQFTLAYANVENITRSGNASFRGTGNAGANGLNGGGGTDILDGAGGTDVLKGGDGNDTLIGGAGADVLDGGAGIDTASYETATVGASANLLTGVVSGASAGDTFSSIEIIKGTAFNDLLRGNAAANTLYGNAGVDDLRGGDGNDVLHGGDGKDRLLGEVGNDRLSGGAGDDIFYFNGGGGRDTVTDFAAGAASGDVLRIAGSLPFESFEEIIAVASQSGANTVIRFDANNSVTLLNVSLASLDAGDFLFI